MGHIFPELAPGEIGIHRSTAMASMDRFCIEFRGAGTHGATPHRGVDPIVMGGQFLSALQTLTSREINPVHPVVVTVGTHCRGNRLQHYSRKGGDGGHLPHSHSGGSG